MSRQRIVFAGVLALAAFASLLAAGPRQADWKAVEDAINKGLPKTAIEKLEPIIAAAMNEEKYAEAIKAIGMKIVAGRQHPGQQARRKDHVACVPRSQRRRPR